MAVRMIFNVSTCGGRQPGPRSFLHGTRKPLNPLVTELVRLPVASHQNTPEEKKTMPPTSPKGFSYPAEMPTGFVTGDFPPKKELPKAKGKGMLQS